MDLASKKGCGFNFTADAAGAFTDEAGHGTHVIGTIAGTGSANSRYRGVATGVGESGGTIRAAKVWGSDNTGNGSWMESAIDWMALPGECDNQPAPLLINISGGGLGTGLTGTDSRSRKLDYQVWINRQLYVVAAGNEGPASQTIRTPGVAKNALTVGSVFDNNGYLTAGDIAPGSSRGPTGDGRMKPNLVAPGQYVTSAQAGTIGTYISNYGTSMATPHVTGLAATLMEHYPSFQFNPAMLRAHMMATAMAHEGVLGKSNDYGLGRPSGYVAHWAHTNNDGWLTYRYWGNVSAQGYQYGDITVPPDTQRLVVVLTWDEPPASAGASEYVVVNNPPPGTYRLKVVPYHVPGIVLAYGLAATIIRGDPTPPVRAYMTAPANPVVGSTFGVTLNVSTPSYVASGIGVEPFESPPGVTLVYVETTRLDGVTMRFYDPLTTLTLGNVVPRLSRSATWFFTANSPGPKTFGARGWWENQGEFAVNTTVEVVPAKPDLVETAMTANPPAPIRAPGTTFAVTDTVQNVGMARSGPSTTRYYLSLDEVKSAGDILLAGSHSAHGLDPGASQTATTTVTIPSATPPNTYFLLACADDPNALVESDEGNNCLASPTAIVTVAMADLVETTVTATPPAPIRAPGTTFSVTDTVQNVGPAVSGPSTTRYTSRSTR